MKETDRIREWLARDYETQQHWAELGRKVYLLTNGDSVLARHRLAAVLRANLAKTTDSDPAKVEYWNEDYTDTVVVEVTPPNVKAANALYVDWLLLADYVLLAAGTPWDGLDEENQRRKEISDRAEREHEAREMVRRIQEYLGENPGASDIEIKAALDQPKREVNAVQIRLAKNSERLKEEPIPDAPQMLRLYKSYFYRRKE